MMHSLLAFGFWLLAFGFSLLAFRFWLFAFAVLLYLPASLRTVGGYASAPECVSHARNSYVGRWG